MGGVFGCGGSEAADDDEGPLAPFAQAQAVTLRPPVPGTMPDDEKALAGLFTEDYRLIPLMVIFDKAGRRVWNSGEGPKLNDEQIDKKIEELLAK